MLSSVPTVLLSVVEDISFQELSLLYKNTVAVTGCPLDTIRECANERRQHQLPKCYFLKTDISKCFDSIKCDRLLQIIQGHIEEVSRRMKHGVLA